MHARLLKQIALAALLTGAACAAQAHRPWLLPTAVTVETNRDGEAWATIDGAISEGLFDVDHMPQKLEGLTVTGPDGATAPAPAAVVGKHRASVDVNLPKDGTYRFTLAAVNVMGSYKLNGETKRFRATEQTVKNEVPAGAADVRTTTMVQRQDTFVTRNTPSMGAFKPVGAGLEMVPLTSPTELRAGEPARVRFLLDGKPLPNFPFSLIPGGVKFRGTLGEVRFTTDANGDATIKLPMPQQYWLSAAYPANAPRGPGNEGPAESRRYSYSATLEVLPD